MVNVPRSPWPTPSPRGPNRALFLGVVAFDDAADDVRAETARGQEAHLAGDFGRFGGRLTAGAGKPATPHVSGPIEFRALEFGGGVGVQRQPVLGQFSLDSAVAEAPRAGMHPGFDEALLTEQSAGLKRPD